MNRLKGFSLTELMIAVVIVAVLASVAIPSYQDSVRRARRADAKTTLLEASQWMERFYTENNRYDQNLGGTAVAGLIPNHLKTAPKEGATKYYNLSLSAVAQNTYTLQAVPISTTDQNNDQCKTLTLTNLGVKGLSGSSASVDDCWGR